jgi:hypothetical protein
MNTTNPSMANPYVGPRTFTKEEHHLFFGREQEARDLLNRVLSERLVLFYAQSGAGKSSLINTRLIPQLRKVGYAVLPVGRVGGELPADTEAVDNLYLFNLMRSLVTAEREPARFAHLTLAQFLAGLSSDDAENYYYDPAAAEPSIPDAAQPAMPYVLIVDQFEELLTSHPGRWQEQEEFFRQLNAAMLGDRNLWVVLTLREDHLAPIEAYAPLLADRMRARFYMERMGVEAALQAIRQPAELGGRRFADHVAETLCERLRQVHVAGEKSTVAGQYVEPVQLQVVCYQLWEQLNQKGARGAITSGDLDEAGNVEQALASYYDQVLAQVLGTPSVQVSEGQLRNWFSTRLITEAGTRGFVLQIGGHTGELPNAVVNLLVSKFLVRRDRRAGGDWYELTHDTFISPILASNQKWRQKQTPPEITAFSVAPMVVSPGISATLHWQVQNAETLQIEPIHYTSEKLQGACVVTPISTTTYVLRATRAGAPAVASPPQSVTVVERDLTLTQSQLLRSMQEERCCVLVGPEIDRTLLPFLLSSTVEEWVAQALTDQRGALGERYLRQVKKRLLEEASAATSQTEERVAAGNLDLNQVTVSELALQLGYLDRHPERCIQLNALAALPIPIYMTTSQHTLLEETLRRFNKQPQTELCRWFPDSETLLLPFGYEPGYQPSAARPAVFHLYGVDLLTGSLALNEDDYVTFLMQVREDRERIPLVVRYALQRHFNILIGFDPEDWAFKSLYHGLITWNYQRRIGGILQIDSPVVRSEREIKLLEAGFARRSLDLFWGSSSSFLQWLVQLNERAIGSLENRAELQRLLQGLRGNKEEAG